MSKTSRDKRKAEAARMEKLAGALSQASSFNSRAADASWMVIWDYRTWTCDGCGKPVGGPHLTLLVFNYLAANPVFRYHYHAECAVAEVMQHGCRIALTFHRKKAPLNRKGRGAGVLPTGSRARTQSNIPIQVEDATKKGQKI